MSAVAWTAVAATLLIGAAIAVVVVARRARALHEAKASADAAAVAEALANAVTWCDQGPARRRLPSVPATPRRGGRSLA